MSNVKQITIKGEMTFDASPGEMIDGIWNDLSDLSAVARSSTRTDEALRLLGQISLPTNGLRINWTGQRMVENNHGGQMTMMAFEITGAEAWSWGAVEAAVKVLRFVGVVHEGEVVDVDNPQDRMMVLNA